MTVIQAIRMLLDSEWTSSIEGRVNDVPKPLLVEEKKNLKDDLRTQDVAHVGDGGPVESTPMGFGWTHERIDATVVVQLRSADRDGDVATDGRHRMFGERFSATVSGSSGVGETLVGDHSEAERYGGLVGETERLMKAHRKGFAEFDIVADGLRVEDESTLAGPGYYRADVYVPLANVASPIDTTV